MALFSGDTFEDMVASLTWPCALPLGWSVEWVRPRPTMIMPSDVTYEIHRDIVYRRLVELIIFSTANLNSDTTLCLNFKYFAEIRT